jgi:hypothetical protein
MNILREAIRGMILEKANRDMSGLALSVSSENGLKILLYDAETFVNGIKEHKKLPEAKDMLNIVKGFIHIKPAQSNGPCHNAWTVAVSGAVDGYGPTLDDIAISLAPSKTLMPDLGGSYAVSASALSVWKYYKEKRGDVTALKLDNTSMKSKSQKEKTPSKDDDCALIPGPNQDILGYAYRLTGNPPINVSLAVQHHSKLMGALQKIGAADSFRNILSQVSRQFLGFAEGRN